MHNEVHTNILGITLAPTRVQDLSEVQPNFIDINTTSETSFYRKENFIAKGM